MSRPKQSFTWWSFAHAGVTPEQLVSAAAEIGYDGIELAGQEYWQMIKDAGLTIASTGGHLSIEKGLNRREQHERIEKEILTNLELAVKWNIPNLICFSGNRDGLDDEQGLEITVEGLKRVKDAAEVSGVTLVLELLNSRVDHPDYQCDKSAWGIKVCEQVDSPRVKLLYDIYHAQIMEGDLIRTIENHHRHFAHYHTAGNPGRHDIDGTQEIYYPPIFQAIATSGYTGFIGHEFVPKGDTIQALRATFELCHLALGSISA